MDVAYYLSELLGQHSEVNVPGLGYFVQLRLNGYYDNDTATFHPPRHQVNFDPQTMDDDDLLAQYIANKKNISLASSKYFTEKYISNLKQEALKGEVQLADLGWLYFDQRIRFKPADAVTTDPAFYGYAELHLSKLGSTSIFDQLESIQSYAKGPAYTTPVSGVPPETVLKDEPVNQPEVFSPPPVYEPVPEVYTPLPSPVYTPPAPAYTPPVYTAPSPAPVYTPQAQPEEQEEFVFRGKTYVDKDKPGIRWWIFVVIFFSIVGLALLGLFAIYKFKPAAFRRLMGAKPAPISIKVLQKKDTAKHDSIKSGTEILKADTNKATKVIVDTTAKTNAKPTTPPTIVAVQSGPLTVVDSAKTRYEIIGTNCKTVEEAQKIIKNFKSVGIDKAHILDAPANGRLIKISLGTYYISDEAIAAKKKLISSGNVKKDIYIKEINPK